MVGGSAPIGEEREKVRRTRTRQELREHGFTPFGILAPAALIIVAILLAAVVAWAVSSIL